MTTTNAAPAGAGAPAAAPNVARHDQRDTIREDVVYPEHAQRTESPLFAKNKQHLLRDMGYGCFICGSQTKLEVHHRIVEWAMWGEADPAKVLAEAKAWDVYGFCAQMGDAPFESPDDIRNLLVLCGETVLPGADGKPVVVEGGHHRGVDCGIHRLSFPIWIGQKIAREGVEITLALPAEKAA